MKFLGTAFLLAAFALFCQGKAPVATADCYGYAGYQYYPAGYYSGSYWPSGYYRRTAYGWYRYGYGYTSGTYCHHGYEVPPQLYTQVIVHKEPVLVPTYSVGYAPPAVDPATLPQRPGMASVAPRPPSYNDLTAQLNQMRAEIAALRAQRGEAAAGNAPTGNLASCVGCHKEGGSGTGKDGLTMFKGGKLAIPPEAVAQCVDAVNEGRMPKGAKWSDAQKVAANRELMGYLKAVAQQKPPQP